MTGAGGARAAVPRSIALIHYAAPPVIGGVESVMAAHARLMAAAGHDVRIVAGRGAAAPDGWRLTLVPLIDPRHAHVEATQVALNAGRVPHGFEPLVSEIRAELERALTGVELVIAHNVCSLNLNLALTAALHEIHDRRVILWHHDVAATMPDYRATLHEGYPWSLLREAWPGATQVVVSERRRRELAAVTNLSLDEITVVPNGVDLERVWALEPQAAVILDRLTRADVELLLLVPARVTPRKNIELALEVVAALRADGVAAALVVTGPVDPHRPSEHAYLDQLLEQRAALGLDGVAWILAEDAGAALSDAVVSDLYRMADVLFLPSRDEGFGLPILEAGASRLPIACADIPTLREVAGGEALYFGLDDPPTRIATRLWERLATDPAWRLSRRVRTEYTWDRIYRTHLAPLLGQ
jgi:glycosyltransferase involved in cell wall biosynthesis